MAPSVVRRLFCLVPVLLAPVAMAEPRPEDPYFREALFHAYQEDYFEALGRLDSELAQHYGVDERNLDSLYPYVDHAEFSVGDFELRYRMHARAGRAIRAVLEGDVSDETRADAAYRLAKIHFEKDQPGDALEVLDSVAERVPKSLREDVAFLRANALLALDRPTEAAEILRPLLGSEALSGFSAYNLGIALLEQGEPLDAVIVLDRAGKISANTREARAIRDKANLVLGTLLFEGGQQERGREALDRIRLDGPFSNQALLRAGWSEVAAEEFERAVVPWSILAKRDGTDAAVQEAQLALPFAYSRLDVHSRAAVLYQRAVNSFGDELEKLDASLESIQGGDFLRALEREEIRKDKDWVVRLRSLPDAPETFYLISLMASHDFQTALQNYLDLAEMREKLLDWQRSLDAFDDMIRIRRAYYEPLMPEIDRQFRKLDAQMRVRLEQRRHLDERLGKLLVAPDPELLTTSDEFATQQTIAASLERVTRLGDVPGAAAVRARLERLQGVLLWHREMQYHERLTDVHQHLRDLNADVDALQSRYDAFVRTRQAARQSYVGYGGQIARLRAKATTALEELAGLRKRQGRMLERVAQRELLRRRERLASYQNKARFAFADSYDRAAKNQAR